MEVTTREYTLLFNTITAVIEKLDALKAELIFAQQQAVEIVIGTDKSMAKM